MKIETSVFGKLDDGREISRYDVTNNKGLQASIMSYGAACISVRMPDKSGKIGEITLGFDNFNDYLKGHPYFGVTVGRFANRIAHARFNLGGIEYRLHRNDGENHLHGGLSGFDKAVWSGIPFQEDGTAGVKLSYTSRHLEEGYPGNLQVLVIYTLSSENELTIEYTAVTDKPTPVNLTNHTYWNLSGDGSGPVYDHELQLFADRYLPVNNSLIPTGEKAPVDGTPFDFTESKPVGRDIEAAGGFDHCFLLNHSAVTPAPAAELHDPASGRTMAVYGTQPAIQFYSGNFLDGITGRSGRAYKKHGALCLETEGYPDAVNQQSFPSVILQPGSVYREKTVHRFSVQ